MKATISLSKKQAKIALDMLSGDEVVRLPKQNSTLHLTNDTSVRQLPVRQRKGKHKSGAKAFRLYGSPDALRPLLASFGRGTVMTYSTK